MTLADRARLALEAALAPLMSVCAPTLVESLEVARQSLNTPMQVAVVGRVKTGKSTLMNSLMGQQVALTGPEELTYNVNSFVYRDVPGIAVFFKDGRSPQHYPIEALGQFVDRTAGDPETLRSIREVEVGLPKPILQRLQLVDTPGFGSFFETDSRNTLEFLGLVPSDVDDITDRAVRGAHAVLYLFTRGLATDDRDLVDDFQGVDVGEFTPVNAMGLLTKVDAYWSGESPLSDPLVKGRNITSRLMEASGANRLFFDILPVCGLLASGASSMTEDDLAGFEALANVSSEELAYRLRNARRFARTDYQDISLSPEQRRSLILAFGLYGIWLAASLIRSEGSDLTAVRTTLIERSGLAAVEHLLLAHFADRATLIKVSGSVRRCRAMCAAAAQIVDSTLAVAAAQAAGRLEEFEVKERALSDLALLRRLYLDVTRLGLADDEVHEVVILCGERGSSCAARLGADDRATPRELLAIIRSRLKYWRIRGTGFGLSHETSDAVRHILRSYEVIAHHVRIARAHLELEV